MKKTLLCIAEKNSVAKTASYILSKGKYRNIGSSSKYNPNYCFDGEFQRREVQIIFSSVAGRVYELKFDSDFDNWYAIDPVDLFSARVYEAIDSESQNMAKNITNLANDAHILFLWLDNDREGEFISEEVEKLCKSVNHSLEIHRARFSALSQSEVWHAFNHPTTINRNEALAVRLRCELDLRSGSAFTRFLTKRYKGLLPGDKTISYGPCQFPTLGFIVDSYIKHIKHVPEPYWTITPVIEKNGMTCSLKWQRKRLFCKLITFSIYSSVLESPNAKILSMNSTKKNRLPPFPLTTVEMQKRCSKYLHIDSHKSMTIAEKLYQKGFISYPRTETDSYPKDFNFDTLINAISVLPAISQYSRDLLNKGIKPRNGNNSDNAHPPIYPLKVPANLGKDENEVYLFICRHFLASISPEATGLETKVYFGIAQEVFKLKGLSIIDKSWFEIYPYNKWECQEIPVFKENEIIQPISIKMTEEKTSPPPLLTEADLISKMHKEGIGTDATYQEHIKKIQDRGYTIIQKKLFTPTSLGLALVLGYEKMGFDFAKPKLRAELEKELQQISKGAQSFEESKRKFVNQYRLAYELAQERVAILDKSFKKQKEKLDQINGI